MSVATPPLRGPVSVTRSMTPDVRDAARAVNDAYRQLQAARRDLCAALDERAERPGRQVGEHGTPAGYRAHVRADTAPCPACIEGHSWAKRRWQLRARRATA